MNKNNRLLYLIITILSIWCLLLSIVIVNNNNNKTENINEYNIIGFSTDFTKIIDSLKPSVVTIRTDKSVCSGFVYKQDGETTYIVTCSHGVVDNYDVNVIFANNYSARARVLDYDKYLDVAVIETNIPYNIEPLKLADSTLAKQGEFVISIGTPSSIEYAGSVEFGMISNNFITLDNSITVDNEVYTYYLDVIQTSSNLKNGYSGSPLINMQGEVVGLNTMANTNNNCFAVTSNELKIVADGIIGGMKLEKNQLGISGTYVTNMYSYEKANLNLSIDTITGLYVSEIKELSIASRLGVRAGDIIMSINDIEIKNVNDFNTAVYNATDSFEIVVNRNAELLTFTGSIND